MAVVGNLRRVRVKICCISTEAEVTLAVRHGASAVGLVSAMPSGPGVIPEERIRDLAAITPPGVASFLLTSKTIADDIADQQRRCRTGVIQLCDAVDPGELAALRVKLPGIGLVQVIHVLGEESIEQAVNIAPHVDALLLDSGNPGLRVKELGGTGRTHNWAVSRDIVKAVDKPVYLAGGLNPENVYEAIKMVQPFGVDLCGGIRVGGKLNDALLKMFMTACGY